MGNSLKYAFPPEVEGLIQVSLDAENGRLLLRVGDNGKGMPPGISFENPESFGFQVVSLLTQRLDGRITLSREGGGCGQ